MPTTYSYQFLQETTTITLNLTCSDTASDTTGYGPSYAVISIGGSIGQTLITGEVGTGGVPFTDSAGSEIDNAVFTTNEYGVSFSGGRSSNHGLDYDGVEFTAGGTSYNIYDDSLNGAGSFGIVDLSAYTTTPITLVSSDAPCYCTNTLIRTARGDVAVEHLAVGDVVVTASGAHRLIRWIGSRLTHPRQYARPNEAQPVRVSAHAFAANRPARDLLVSPGHSLCVDVVGEVLIPAAVLINGTTVTQEDVDTVTYWHIELDSHDILLAENMPAESYLEMGNRGFFAQTDVTKLQASPDASVVTHADFCRPFHAEGALVEVVRTQLSARAVMLGWRLEEPGSGDLHLLVDGVRVCPCMPGLSVSFAVPAGAKTVWLASGSSIPAEIVASSDRRSLGICIAALSIDDVFGATRSVALDDPRLCVGFHDVEQDGGAAWRWTAGRALLPASLWEGLEGGVILRIKLAGPTLPRWVAPTAAAAHIESVRLQA